jgi:aryl-alcohol dehydrogenase-like predicted oxidoreductase
MEQRSIGILEVSLAGLGTNNFGRRLDAGESRKVVEAALDAGVTHFDTADIYGEGRSEEYLGRALGARREDVTIASKFGMGASHGTPHAEWVPGNVEESLRRLGTERLDLLYYHRPDPRVPVLETLRVMNGLLDRGLVQEIGCSNFTAAQLDEASAAAEEHGLRGFAVVENEYSLTERAPEQDGVLAAARAHEMAFVPFFPLASGLLSGAYRRGRPTPHVSRLGDGRPAEQILSAAHLDLVERLAAYAEARGRTLLELSLSYLTAHAPVATVIAGATTAEQVRANAAATGAWAFTDEELDEIRALLDRVRSGALRTQGSRTDRTR